MRVSKTSILILVIGIILVITLYKNPPLISPGRTSNIDKTMKIVEIVNQGLVGVTITNVFINNGEQPKDVEVGKSTKQLVLGDIDANSAIVFEDVPGYKVKPNSYKINYGIRVFNDTPINKVVINYRYFGLPFRYSVIFDE